MSYQAEIYNVMLASPNDVEAERQIAKDIILDWNNINSLTRKIVLLPLGWENNSFPAMGDRPQEIINKQVLKNADILIGIFWTRVGTPTGKAISGTVEEITEHINLDKPAMLYFSNKPVVPNSIDSEQYAEVQKLKKGFRANGLTHDFESIEDFKNQFQRHLSMKLNEDEFSIALIKNKIDNLLNIPSQTTINLSDTAKLILLEISEDNTGKLLYLTNKDGFTFQTNGKQINEDSTPRTKAKLESGLNELLNLDMISKVNYEGEIFKITQKGYDFADKLKAE